MRECLWSSVISVLMLCRLPFGYKIKGYDCVCLSVCMCMRVSEYERRRARGCALAHLSKFPFSNKTAS